MTDIAKQEEALAEARSALACIPRTRTRILWQADQGNVRALIAAVQRYQDAGGKIRAFARRLGVQFSTIEHLRRGEAADGRHIRPDPKAPSAVREGVAVVAEVRERVQTAGLRRVDWGRYPDEVAALGRLWLRSRLPLTTFARGIGLDPTALKLHFRTSQGDSAREALQAALDRITHLEAMLADAERRAAEVRR